MTDPRLILIGGFLGSGKSSWLERTARVLTERGMRVGLITNDQSTDLVDTAGLRRAGLSVEEVSGGCFCCKFDDLVSAAKRLAGDNPPDVILGEPVGSCTDITATVLEPVARGLGGAFRLSPFSVLVDPVRVIDFLNAEGEPDFSESIMYIYGKQLEEADRILVNKCDLLAESGVAELVEMLRERFPDVPVEAVSARDGRGAEAWLDAMLAVDRISGKIPEVDYERYAKGEAELGWMNAAVLLSAQYSVEWGDLLSRLLREMQRGVAEAGGRIAHLKVLVETERGAVRANLVSTAGTIDLVGEAEPGVSARLVINARVAMDPEALRKAVLGAVDSVTGEAIHTELIHAEAFQPVPPRPMHRMGGSTG